MDSRPSIVNPHNAGDDGADRGRDAAAPNPEGPGPNQPGPTPPDPNSPDADAADQPLVVDTAAAGVLPLGCTPGELALECPEVLCPADDVCRDFASVIPAGTCAAAGRCASVDDCTVTWTAAARDEIRVMPNTASRAMAAKRPISFACTAQLPPTAASVATALKVAAMPTNIGKTLRAKGRPAREKTNGRMGRIQGLTMVSTPAR